MFSKEVIVKENTTHLKNKQNLEFMGTIGRVKAHPIFHPDMPILVRVGTTYYLVPTMLRDIIPNLENSGEPSIVFHASLSHLPYILSNSARQILLDQTVSLTPLTSTTLCRAQTR